jgi:hypothetical protein
LISSSPRGNFLAPSLIYFVNPDVHLLAGLVVPDVPLEETEILRKEAKKNGIELVCLPLSLIYSFPLFLDSG